MKKTKVSTIWLSGCSGCHMSFLDQDELLLELAKKIQMVYSPLMDIKTFPENVDLTLIEGAVANEEQQNLLKEARKKTKILISLGDCAVTGNVTALRNAWSDSDQAVLKKAYMEKSNKNGQIPTDVPKLLKKVRPIHEVVNVDYFIPGCPPPAGVINYVLTELLAGKTPNMEGRSKYG
ncbi:MAG: oxidoreductase [Candidatus Bathyarchaeota archaeon]|nr:oxidoreductase [Candidatus Bathyarchaeum tardum]WGM90709.1 MAG: oxidoreductase [Candidatus Bathyarchaeum tardum]WNZ30392.1 MAG: oxidoreductase [Candidatus Bathyarchaeota archaeon]